MRHFRRFWLCSLLVALGFASRAVAESASQTDERQLAAHVLAFGVAPESHQPATGHATIASLLEQHRTRLQADAKAGAAVRQRAWRDAFGRDPSSDEIREASSPALTYADWMRHHVTFLGSDKAANYETLRRAYLTAVRREPYPEEIDYWRPHGALPFVVLVACLEDWARRNQPGLMVTAGEPTISPQSRLVRAYALSPAVAAEARAAAGLAVADPGTPRRILVAGADRIVAQGGVHLLVVGRSASAGH
jgi:hypothetical protein